MPGDPKERSSFASGMSMMARQSSVVTAVVGIVLLGRPRGLVNGWLRVGALIFGRAGPGPD
jgi:hypothetical protein